MGIERRYFACQIINLLLSGILKLKMVKIVACNRLLSLSTKYWLLRDSLLSLSLMEPFHWRDGVNERVRKECWSREQITRGFVCHWFVSSSRVDSLDSNTHRHCHDLRPFDYRLRGSKAISFEKTSFTNRYFLYSPKYRRKASQVCRVWKSIQSIFKFDHSQP